MHGHLSSAQGGRQLDLVGKSAQTAVHRPVAPAARRALWAAAEPCSAEGTWGSQVHVGTGSLWAEPCGMAGAVPESPPRA